MSVDFDADHYWRDAAMCQRRADAAIHPDIRDRWLRLAAEYERLANWMGALEPLVGRRGEHNHAAAAEQAPNSRT